MAKVCRHSLVLMIALLASLLVSPGLAQDEPTEGQDVHQTAVLLFISSETINDLVVPVAEVRQTVVEILHNRFINQGLFVLEASVMDAAAGHWRVRNDWAISQPFLDHLNTNLSVNQIQVVHLRAEYSNLTLVSRMLDCPSGMLRSIQQTTVETGSPLDRDLKPIATEWVSALKQLCQSFPNGSPAPLADSSLLLLPANAIGCESDRALTATVSILGHLLAENGAAVPDPALVRTTLINRGIDPARLGEEGRQLLSDTFNQDHLTRMTLVAYGMGATSNLRSVIADDSAASPQLQFNNFDLILRRINLHDGAVVFSHNVFSLASNQTGWFGINHNHTSVERIDLAAGKLWLAINNPSKDQ